MKKLFSALLAVTWLFAMMPMAAHAGTDTVAYKPGALKAAVGKGETVLLHYKSTW